MALNLEVNILGEYKNLSKATKGASNQLKGLQSTTKKISSSINRTFATIGVGLSFVAITRGIQSIVGSASDLEQAFGASEAVFNEFSTSIIANSKTASTQFGLSANDYLKSANLIGAQLSNLGFSTQEYSEKADELVGLGADLAATFGGSTYDAVQSLSAVFRGEYNQVEKYGVALRKSDISARVAEKSMGDLTGEALKQAEAIAALEILYEQTASSQGQFAKETDTLAGALQIMRAGIANASTTLGQAFLPAFAATAGFISQNMPVFEGLADAIGVKVREAFEGSGTAAENFGGKVILALTDLTEFLNGTAESGNAFYDFSQDAKPFLDLLGAIGELGKGLIAVLDGLAEGLFGWLTLFMPGQDALGGFTGLIKILGEFLQELGYKFGFVASFFIPFTAGFKIAGKVISTFSDFIGRLGTVFGKIFGAIRKVFDDTLGAFARGIGSVWKPALGDGLNAIGRFAAGIGEKLRGGPLEGLVRWFTVSIPSAVRFFGGWIDKALGAIRSFASAIGINLSGPTGVADTGERNRFKTLKPAPGLDRNAMQKEYAKGILKGIADSKRNLDTGIPTIPKLVLPEITSPEAESDFVKGIKEMVEVITDAVKDAEARIKSGMENFRDSVQLSFGIITNGAFAVFDVNKVIREMKKIKDAASTFVDDIRKLQERGADASLIDQLLGMDPIAGATAARGLLSSGRLEEFLKLRSDLAGIGGSAAEAANQGINGAPTSDLTGTLARLNRILDSGVTNSYAITVNNAANMNAKQIVDAIKSYEKTVGKKVFTN